MQFGGALHTKLVRDLWNLRGQVFAIAIVIAAGLSAVMMSLSTLDALRESRAQFYADSGFAQVFARLTRAPEAISDRIRALPGAGIVETRISTAVTLRLPDFDEPVRGFILSVPVALNRLHLVAGRLPEANRDDEIVIGEAFAEAHGLSPGDRLQLVVYGRSVSPRIVGIALSPEFIYQIGPGEMVPDFRRFAIGWMAREPLARALDMEGAFNDVVMTLSPGTGEDAVIEGLDRILAPWGGRRAHGREHQQSHYFLTEEFRQLQHVGQMFSLIFLGISAFLLHVVIGRLVDTQREQIAVLKAFGYGNVQLGWHYARMALAIVLLGCVLGLAAGAWLGHGLAVIYMEYYRLPNMVFRMSPQMIAGATAVSGVAALLGAIGAVRRGVRLAPAEAMRPDPPERYRLALAERLGMQRLLSPVTRMILRQIGRRPLRASMTVAGVALATGVMVSGIFFPDSMALIVDSEFNRASRESLSVTFTEETGRRALHELNALPGVVFAEPFRSVAVELRHGHLARRTQLQGLARGAELHRVLDRNMQPVVMPVEGLVVGAALAEVLDLHPGSRVVVDVLDGRHSSVGVEVVGIVQQWIGMGAYMEIDALNRLLGDGDVISGAYLGVPEHLENGVQARLVDRPRVAGTQSRRALIRSWKASFETVMLTFVGFIAAMAAAITLGVVYNTARITLSERVLELASLRILGFTRTEISRILLGELAILVMAAIPLGFVVGWWLSLQWAAQAPSELVRIPVVISGRTLAGSAVVVLTAAVLTGLLVRRRLDRLDLAAALKGPE